VPVTIRLARNGSHVPSFGVVEEVPSGTADRWVSMLCQSAFVATQATRASLIDFEFSVRVGGEADGPSGGLLLTSTLAALLEGKRPLPNTSMTGAINPDGSVGPVGGVLERLQVAAGAGVKRFGLPLGVAPEVLTEARKLGVEVKELASLEDAYEFLTGAPLKRGVAATEQDMELWPAELNAIGRLRAQVQRDYDEERPRLEEALEGFDPKAAAATRSLLERSLRAADDFAKSGDTVRAMVVWSATLTSLRVASQDLQLVRALDAKDFAGVLATLKAREEALPRERKELRDQIATQFPNTTRANDVYAMDLFESVVTQGGALRAAAAAKELQALFAAGVTEQTEPRFRRLARDYAEALLRFEEELANGRRFVTLYASLPPLKKPRRAIDAARLAAWYVAAGGAARAAFKLRPPGSALESDGTYLDLVGYSELLTTETDARARLVIAARQTVYSAYLINTYDSLGAEVDAKGALTIRNTRALATQLELAKVHALQSCGEAKQQLGSIPFPARMRFLNARAAREGNSRQKADALADLWISSWWCEFAVREKN
jgi:hypothetical protein